jgi:LPXTG-site transpeptidase (sortase) family protein
MSNLVRSSLCGLLRPGIAIGTAVILAIAGVALQPPESASAAGRGCVTPGTDGPNAALTGVVNSYYPATASAAAGATAIQVGARIPAASPAIAAGDLLLVIQMQDADISGTNAITYGDGATGRGSTALRSTGFYEYVAATGAVVAGSVNIAGSGGGAGLINNYDFSTTVSATNGFRTFQVIRVPQYSSATVAAGLTAAAWDGAVHAGGVLAIDVAGALNLNGQTISVNQLGFKGGLGVGQVGGPDANTDYAVASARGDHGYKAEGIAGTPHFLYDAIAGAAVNGAADGYPLGDAARGAPGNAGGGGTDGHPVNNTENSGGGGGANGGQGGMGGNSWAGTQPPGGLPVGGLGGAAFPAAAARVVLGGGGGAGSRNNSSALMSSGGTGGGIVMIRSGTVTGAGTITADGGVGVTPDNDGGGGGGAGGSIVVTVNAGTVNGVTARANGGNGTDAWPKDAGGLPDRHGPGGGGSGGVVITSNALPPGQASVLGGTHGITTTLNDAYGATGGNPGAVLITAPAAIPGSSSGAECVPALTVVKTTSTPAVTNTSGGTTATYSITVSNGANVAPATSVSISDTLPAGFTYATTGSVVLNGGATRPATVNPAAGASTPVFGTFSIPAAGSVVINFTVNIAASVVAGTYNNPAAGTYLDPTRTTLAGTTGSTYPGGGVERVTVSLLPGLPNTSGPQLEAEPDASVAWNPTPNLWLAAVALIAGMVGLGIGARWWIGTWARFRQRRRRPAFALPVLLSLALCTLAVSQVMPSTVVGPTGSSLAGAASAPIAPVDRTSVELIGATVVSHAKPSPPVEERFYPASGAITPSRIRIAAIAVDAPVAGVGLLPDGSMGVPNNLWIGAWLSSGPRPGQAGNAVIAGHRGIGSPGLFGHLENVRPGDRIRVSDASHGELVYEVTRVALLDLSVDSQMQVFGPTTQQQLVLITCFGQYSRTTQTYDHRLVVFSRLLPPNT